MFTGIIEETGIVENISRKENSAGLTIKAKKILERIQIGDSIAVNGICLTVTSFNDFSFTADVMAETLKRTSLTGSNAGMSVNLERALAAEGRFGGHIVSGHIDGVGTILATREIDIAVIYQIAAPLSILEGIVEKGSVAIDGISLTVVDVNEDSFSVSVIPHTKRNTNLSQKRIGDILNIETDIIGKYIKKYMTSNQTGASSSISMSLLEENGFI